MGKFTEFKLPLKSLPQGEHHYSYRLDKAFFVNMESDDIHGAALDVSLHLTHQAGVYHLHFAVTGQVTLLCDRCLDDLAWPIDATYDITVKYGDDYDDSTDGILMIPLADNDLNVAYMLYDTVALAIPLKHVHPAGKCNRRMTDSLRRHQVTAPADDPEDDVMEEQLIEEIDDIDNTAPTPDDQADTDPRWDALKGLASHDTPDEP